MTPRLSTLVLVSSLALSTLACASPPSSEPAKMGALDGSVVLVTPFNLGIRRAPELDDTTAPVAAELIEALQASGAEVQVLSHQDALELWQEAFRAGPAAGGFPAAAARFARLAAEETEFDLVLLPSLLLRGAEMNGRRANWDGVSRDVPMQASVPDSQGEVEGVRIAGLTGLVSAASIHLVALEPAGNVAFQGIAGLDVIQQAHRLDSGGADSWQLERREEPLRDLDHIRHGIELAFERELPKTAHAWSR